MPNRHKRHVVETWGPVGECTHIVQASGDQLIGLPRSMLMHQCHDAVHAVFIARITGFPIDRPCKERECRRFQLHARSGKLRLAEHPQRGIPVESIEDTPPRPTTIAGQCPALWISTSPFGLASPHTSVAYCPASALSQKNRLTWVTIWPSGSAIPVRLRKQRVKLRHHHRSSHSLAGDVPQQKEKLPIGRDQVAVVAADSAKRRKVIARLPYADAQSFFLAAADFCCSTFDARSRSRCKASRSRLLR